MAIGPTVSKISRGERWEGSDHSEMDYKSLKCNVRLYWTWMSTNDLPWRRFALSECFVLEVITDGV